MAIKERYMLHTKVTRTDSFMNLDFEAQMLYVRLNEEADGVGFVGGLGMLMRGCGIHPGKLDELIKLGLVIPFRNKELVYITQYLFMNNLRKDRMPKTDYIKEFEELKKILSQYDDGQGYVNGMSLVCQRYALIEGNSNSNINNNINNKDKEKSKSKGRNNGNGKRKEQKKAYGQYQHVTLSSSELQSLNDKYGKGNTELYIEKVDNYMERTGKQYNNCYLTLRQWLEDDKVTSKGSDNYEPVSI